MTSRTEQPARRPGRATGPSNADMAAGVGLVVVATIALLPFVARENESVRNFSLVFASIMLEAMPFMLLGTVVGGVVEVFVSRERLERYIPTQPLACAAIAGLLGLVFPVCECAIVPVVRRLAGKGLPAAAAIAYLLAGPIVNPVVAASTWMAYSLDWRPVAVRLVGGYVIAVAVAYVMARLFPRDALFAPGVDATHQVKHHHHHCGCGCSHGHDHGVAGTPLRAKIAAAGNHALDDLMATAPYLVLGAALAALAQTGVDRRLFVTVRSSTILSSVVMMGLAVLLNLCSEADAFIAASFRGLTPFSGQVAFLLIGPMVDIKLLLMYRVLFRHRAVPVLVLLVTAAVFALSLLVAVIGGTYS